MRTDSRSLAIRRIRHSFAEDRTTADRVRSELGPLLKLRDQPHVHVLVTDGVAMLHGDVSDIPTRAAVEAKVLDVAGVRGLRSKLHIGLLRSDTRPSAGRQHSASNRWAAQPALAIGIMGSASPPIHNGSRLAARELGRAVARAGCTLVTGACPGLPDDAVKGAKESGGLVIGISPALSAEEHVDRFASPLAGFDLVIFTGSGLMGREVINIRTSDMVVIIAGHSGTLGEFAIAYDEGRLIGVLTGTGGVADLIESLVPQLSKETGARVLYDDDPDRLVSRLIDYYVTQHAHRPHVFANPGAGVRVP
ncbi:MAG TPA: hypothetical protein VFJ17_05200 [Mycobacteriales bacterium]|jgi:uncharacterized protein (TIGR00725 family)|nr:hypothetical protein [Mycobacteriales bacterium]